MSDTRMTAQEAGVVKAAAAARYRELGIRPQTAEYLFKRFTAKQAKQANVDAPAQAPDPKTAKLASSIAAAVDAVRARADKSDAK